MGGTGDGVVDFATHIVGANSESPAQMTGPPGKGIVNVEQFFACFA